MSQGNAATDRLLMRAMNVSLAAGVLLLGARIWLAAHTGSAGVLGDAAESAVHLLAVIFASYSLRVARKPPDSSHLFGHGKAQYFSAGVEGALISLAAMFIAFEAIRQLVAGPRLEHIGTGIAVTGAIALVNLFLGLWLLRTGRRHHSILLLANGRHVLTDVWTSGGVVIGLALAATTGQPWWDPIVALLISANILRTGIRLVRQAVGGLMDESSPETDRLLRRILGDETQRRDLEFHQLRHRFCGGHHWVEFHLVFPSQTTVEAAHEAATEIERTLHHNLRPSARIITHLEPRSAAKTREPWEI